MWIGQQPTSSSEQNLTDVPNKLKFFIEISEISKYLDIEISTYVKNKDAYANVEQAFEYERTQLMEAISFFSTPCENTSRKSESNSKISNHTTTLVQNLYDIGDQKLKNYIYTHIEWQSKQNDKIWTIFTQPKPA